MRKWALRLCIYSYVADIAMVVLFWRFFAEFLNRPEVIDRATALYTISISCAFTSLILLLIADFKKVPDQRWKVAIYAFVIIAILGKGINYLNESGYYWAYWGEDIVSFWGF